MEAAKKPRSEAQKAVPEKARAVKAVLTDARRAEKLKEKEMKLYSKALDTVNNFNKLMLPANEAPAVKPPKVIEPESEDEEPVAVVTKKKKRKVAPPPESESDEEPVQVPQPVKRVAKPTIDYGAKRFIFS